jgi:hypothetical protein
MSRLYAVTLAANLNQSTPGAILDVTGAAGDIGAWSREAEKELTKVSPSAQDLTLEDGNGAIWTWLQEQIGGSGAGVALYPPWVTVDVDGQRAFTGFAYPRQISRDQKTNLITISAQDWSSALSAKYLGADLAENDLDPTLNPWLRPYPRAASNRIVANRLCSLKPLAYAPGGYDYIRWDPDPMVWISIGDYVTCDLASRYPGFPVGHKYKVASIQHFGPHSGYDEDTWVAALDGFGQDVWDHIHQGTVLDDGYATFTRAATTTDLRAFYVVTTTVFSDAQGVHEIQLDTVDGIAPGDVLIAIGTTTAQRWTILQVDAEHLVVVTREQVQNVLVNTHLFFAPESLADLVLDDARSALKRAVALSVPSALPYSVDFSRFVPPTVSNPVLVWLPLRSPGSDDLTTVRSLDQGLADFRVYGAGASAWNGTPEAGWATTATTTLRAPWTGQLLAAPATTMPNEAATLAPGSPADHVVLALAIRDTLGTPGVPTVNLIYDYLQMRRIVINQTRSVSIAAWSGSAWGTPTVVTWPGAVPVLSASVLPGAPGAVVGLTSAGLQLVMLPGMGASNVVAVPAVAKDAVLRTTPWGCYLVGSQGYGRVTYAAGVLALNWLTLSTISCFYPNTFTAMNANEIMVLARVDGQATGSTDLVTEVHLLRLQATPTQYVEDTLVASEKLMDGAPRTAGAFRDPTQGERIFGHCGGRLFVFGRTLPTCYAIERYTPSGLKAAELIEHICQVLNCMAVPDPLGCIHIISRGLVETPIDLTVDQVEIQEVRTWEHFYSVVRVSSAKDSSILADAWGTAGGTALEYGAHPFLWGQSACSAVAESLAAWFGVPRRYHEESWFWTDTDHPAPWENLPPVATIRINGQATKWIVLAIKDDKVNGQADVKLVEVF